MTDHRFSRPRTLVPPHSGGGGLEEEFESLFNRFYRPVACFFANRGFGAEECCDLTQETFLGVYRGIHRFRHESSDETWIFKIAANIWRNALRNRTAEKRAAAEVSLDHLLDTGHDPTGIPSRHQSPADQALVGEKIRLLREEIDELPPQMKRCIFLRVDQDMKYREIAAVMQISIDTVKSQLFLARERLKARLGKYFEDFD